MNKRLFSLVFGVLSLGSLSYGADPCRKCPVEIFVDDVSGGLSTTVPDYKIGNQFSPYMRNIIVDNGKVELINGFIEVGSTNTLGAPTGIFPYFQEDGTTEFLVTDSSVVLATSDFSFYTFISSALNTGVLTRCKQIRNNMWCSNSVDSVFSWNGSAKTVLDGTNGTPDVPKGKYIEYYQERVFIYNLNGNASQARYSDFRSTNGVQIAPESFLAWPAGNALNIGRGDGEVGTGIWVENSQLHFGKERSIYTLFGTNPSNYTPRETSPDVGVASHDSIVLMDGVANFLGPDGFYIGRTRISDHIEDDVDVINKGNLKSIQNKWETQSEFSAGEFYGSTATLAGSLTQITTTYGIPASGPRPDTRTLKPDSVLDVADVNDDLDAGTTFFGFLQAVWTTNPQKPDPTTRLYVDKIFWAVNDITPIAACGAPIASVTVMNMSNGFEQKTVVTDFGGVFDSLMTADFGSQAEPTVLFDGFDILNSTLAVKVEGCGLTLTNPTAGLNIQLKDSTTVQFVSEVSTFNMVTAWGNLDSDRTTGGGVVDYFIRTSTSVINITTQAWSGISPGNIIDAPLINNYIQWAATMTSVSTTALVTKIDEVTIDHIEGSGGSNRAFAEKWKNRYWVFTTTEASDLSLGFIKARNTSSIPVAWMPIEGINIRSLRSDGDTLYAGASSTGVFYRLDFGTNYNGNSIQGVYHTPSKFMGDLFSEKHLFEYYIVDDRATGKEMTLGVSIDNKDFVDQTIDFDGSGQVVKTIRKVRAPNVKGKLFKFKFDFNQLDTPLALRNFGVLYKRTKVRSGINE